MMSDGMQKIIETIYEKTKIADRAKEGTEIHNRSLRKTA